MAKTPETLPGKILAAAGSYWLAVALLVNLFLLTWLGTLAQVDKGINLVQREYFESLYVVSRLPVAPGVGLPIVLPGGMLTMAVFTLNLVVGGLVRIRKSKRTIGIITAHVGIGMMMVGGAVEYWNKDYGALMLYEGERGSQYRSYTDREIAIWQVGSDVGVEEHLIHESDFDDLDGDARRTFESDALPFEVILSRYMVNCTPERAVGVGVPGAPVIDGLYLKERERFTEPERDLRGVYVSVITDGGASMIDTFLLDKESRAFAFDAAGRTWAMALRREVHQMPFSIQLVDFVKDDHPGTTMARSYSSDVKRIDPDGTEVDVHIRMNEPLRHGGYIAYQSGFGPQNGQGGPPYSIFAISNNPSDRIPWLAVSIIAIGLLWTFTTRLFDFLVKQRRRAVAAAVAADASTGASRPDAADRKPEAAA